MTLYTPTLNYAKPQDNDPVDELVFDANWDQSDAAPGIRALTQAQINALSAAQSPDGLVVYNTTTQLYQMRVNGAWVTAATVQNGRLVNDQAGTGAMKDVAGLSFSIQATEIWTFDIFVYVSAGGTSSTFSWQLTGPAAPTSVLLTGTSIDTSAAVEAVAAVTAFATVLGPLGPAAINRSAFVTLKGAVVNGANPGTVQLQVNTVASNPIKANSWLRAAKSQ